MKLPVVGNADTATGDVDPGTGECDAAAAVIVKLYADVPVKFQAPTVVRMEIGMLLLALVAKVAVPLGVVAGVQFADVP